MYASKSRFWSVFYVFRFVFLAARKYVYESLFETLKIGKYYRAITLLFTDDNGVTAVIVIVRLRSK